MIINHNMMAMNAHRQLGISNNSGAKSMEKLSSGFRINRAGDDAAGLAISEKMRGQIRGLNQASRNAQDGISMIQTAEGALSETHAILQRMRELAVQSSNDTNNDTDRGEIQKEIEQLQSEVTRIADTTEFNTKKLLNGDMGTTTVKTGTDTAKFGEAVASADTKEDTYKVTVLAGTITAAASTNTTGLASNGSNFKMTTGNIAGLELGKYTLETTATGTADTFDFSLKDENGVEVASVSAVDVSAGDAVLTNATTGAKFTVAAVAAGVAKEGKMAFTLGADTGAAGNVVITNSAGGTEYTSAANVKLTDAKFEEAGLSFDLTVDSILTAGNSSYKVTNNSASLQIGANQTQTTNIGIQSMTAEALEIDDIDVSNKTGAESAITKIQAAIEKVSAERSTLGAKQNRLEHSIKNLDTSSENLQAAESRIRDVDMAKEMMNFTKNDILTQAAQSMLAQANSAPQGILQLLR